MNIAAYILAILFAFTYAADKPFASAAAQVAPISDVSTTGNHITFSHDKRGGGGTFHAKNFMTIHINNNNAEGYKVYMRAKKGALSYKTQPIVDGDNLDYYLQCDDFLSAQDGFIVSAPPRINMKANHETLVYNVKNPKNTTYNATANCSLTLASGEKLAENFFGEYSETIDVRIENYHQ